MTSAKELEQLFRDLTAGADDDDPQTRAIRGQLWSSLEPWVVRFAASCAQHKSEAVVAIFTRAHLGACDLLLRGLKHWRRCVAEGRFVENDQASDQMLSSICNDAATLFEHVAMGHLERLEER